MTQPHLKVDSVTQDGESISDCENIHCVGPSTLTHKHKLTTEVFDVPKWITIKVPQGV